MSRRRRNALASARVQGQCCALMCSCRDGRCPRPVSLPVRMRSSSRACTRCRASRNAVWVELALIAADLLALAQTMLLTDEPDLHRAEPKTLRYRLLHTAARITRGQRRVFLRLAQHWPWTLALARAFRRLRLIPLPAYAQHHP